jgi:hypothetical protein
LNNMKRIVIIFCVLFLAGAVLAATNFNITPGPNMPNDHEWLENEMEANNYTIIAQWSIENLTPRETEIDQIILDSFGSGDDTKMVAWIYLDSDSDGKFDFGTDTLLGGDGFDVDNGAKTINIADEELVLAVGETKEILIIEKAIPGEITDNTTFGTYLVRILGHVKPSGTSAADIYGTENKSAEATYFTLKDYFLEFEQTNGDGYVMGYQSGFTEDLYADGTAVSAGTEKDYDFSFKVYSDCEIDQQSSVGGAATNMGLAGPTGQKFKSYKNDFSHISFYMKPSTFAGSTELTARIRTGVGEAILFEEARTFNETPDQAQWYPFEFEACTADCGNGIIDTGEECDSGNLGGNDCTTIEGEEKYYGTQGTLECTATCEFEENQCIGHEEYSEYVCNNHLDEGDDMTSYKEMTCPGYGEWLEQNYFGDTLVFEIDETCVLDLSSCQSEPTTQYFLELVSSTGKANWIHGNEYTNGTAIIEGAEIAEEDMDFIIYENCNKIIENDGYQGYYGITSKSPIGQSFISEGENFSSAMVSLRAGGAGPDDDTLTLRIRKDAIDGEILAEAQSEVTVDNYSRWFSFDFGICAEDCGNGIIDTGEECDSENLGGKQCGDINGYYSGDLSCNGCLFDLTACNTMEEDLELSCNTYAKEGTTGNCIDFNQYYGTKYVSGNYSFDEGCNLDLSGCIGEGIENPPENGLPEIESICGNGILEGNEVCDGSNLNGKSCADFGFNNGYLICTGNCAFNISECYYEKNESAICGNNVREGFERCDGTDMGSYTCEIMGYQSGTATCTNECLPNTVACIPYDYQLTSNGPVCGNGVMETGEFCDGNDFAETDCSTFGWGEGELLCTRNCEIDRINCSFETINPTNTGIDTNGTDNNLLKVNTQTENNFLFIYILVALIIILALVGGAYYIMKEKPKENKNVMKNSTKTVKK